MTHTRAGGTQQAMLVGDRKKKKKTHRFPARLMWIRVERPAGASLRRPGRACRRRQATCVQTTSGDEAAEGRPTLQSAGGTAHVVPPASLVAGSSLGKVQPFAHHPPTCTRRLVLESSEYHGKLSMYIVYHGTTGPHTTRTGEHNGKPDAAAALYSSTTSTMVVRACNYVQ